MRLHVISCSRFHSLFPFPFPVPCFSSCPRACSPWRF